MTELEEKEFNRKFDSWLDSEYDKYCEAEFDKYCQTLEQEKPKQLTQDVFAKAPDCGNVIMAVITQAIAALSGICRTKTAQVKTKCTFALSVGKS